jgi:hypothetical protein
MLEHDAARLAQAKALLTDHDFLYAFTMEQALDLLPVAGPFDLFLVNPELPDLRMQDLGTGPVLLIGAGAGTFPDLALNEGLIWDVADFSLPPGFLKNRIENLLHCKRALDKAQGMAPSPGQISTEAHYQCLKTLSHDLRTPMATIGVTLSSIQRMLTKKPATEIVPKLD